MHLKHMEVVDGMRLRKRKYREHLCHGIYTLFKGVNLIFSHIFCICCSSWIVSDSDDVDTVYWVGVSFLKIGLVKTIFT